MCGALHGDHDACKRNTHAHVRSEICTTLCLRAARRDAPAMRPCRIEAWLLPEGHTVGFFVFVPDMTLPRAQDNTNDQTDRRENCAGAAYLRECFLNGRASDSVRITSGSRSNRPLPLLVRKSSAD